MTLAEVFAAETEKTSDDPTATIEVNGSRATVNNDGEWTTDDEILKEILESIAKDYEYTPADGEPCIAYAEHSVKLIGKGAKMTEWSYSDSGMDVH